MFGKNRFSDNGAQSARSKQPQKSRDQMDYQNKQMAHEQSSLALEHPNSGLITNSPPTGRSVAVPVPDEGPAQWRVGTLHSGAELEIDEPQLDGTQLFVLGASNHLILQGIIVGGAALPAFGVGQWEATGEWHWQDPMQWPLTRQDNQFYIRFDYRWLKIGRYALSLDRTIAGIK